LTHPIASTIPFDHDSPDASLDAPVRAVLVAAMAQHRQYVSIRRSRPWSGTIIYMVNGLVGSLEKKVATVAARVADEEPARLCFERQTGTTEARVAILQSPEDFDRAWSYAELSGSIQWSFLPASSTGSVARSA